MDSKQVFTWEDKVVPTCCPGYAENNDRKCAPICLNGCRHGKCVGPNECECEVKPTVNRPGYMGETCSRFVCMDELKWGSECDQECNCPRNAFCHASTGRCICRTNWKGPNCTEECHSSREQGCNEFVLLPISEPEVNVLAREMSGSGARSQALKLDDFQSILSQPSASLGNDSPGGAVQYALTQTTINMLLLFLTFLMMFTVFRYRQKLNRITNELYYQATSTNGPGSSASTSSSVYTAPSFYSEVGDGNAPVHHDDRGDSSRQSQIARAMQKRPPLPIPEEHSEGSLLSKNLSFASATRDIVKGLGGGIGVHQLAISNSNNNTSRQEDILRNKFLLDPLVECRLAKSQDKSTQNLYSDIDSNATINTQNTSLSSEKSFLTSHDASLGERMISISKVFSTLNMNTNSATDTSGHYQVPKSPTAGLVSMSIPNPSATQQPFIDNELDQGEKQEQSLSSNLISQQQTYSSDQINEHKNDCCDELSLYGSNIYEELKPRPRNQ